METPIESACWPLCAEAAASVANSASCQNFEENIGVLAIVKPELKFVQVQWQILLAHLVIGADDPALEQRPERFNRDCLLASKFAQRARIVLSLSDVARARPSLKYRAQTSELSRRT